jgi:hypothetical protein
MFSIAWTALFVCLPQVIDLRLSLLRKQQFNDYERDTAPQPSKPAPVKVP